ncbi:MAG: RNA-binding transcriptional accessory protein [Eubacteriaceae bacterium]|nr:RNA-binding transcriptional accessory protein [Eubacteriaceae bacterium]
MDKIINILSQEFEIEKTYVENAVSLLNEDNTVPFIARYRKELTGNMSDETLRSFSERLSYLLSLEAKISEVLGLIEKQGKLTQELSNKIQNATQLKEVEDLYLPFRPKKRTRALIAKEKGLEPLSELIFAQQATEEEILVFAEGFVKESGVVETAQDAISGACDIIAESISDNADFRKTIRTITLRNSHIVAVSTSKDEDEPLGEFEAYRNYREKAMDIPGHRILAINRAETKKALKITLEAPEDQIVAFLNGRILKPTASSFLGPAVADSYKRLIKPSIERDIRSMLTEKAEEGAIGVFGRNLRALLLSPPIKGKTIMGFDPGFRTGCKIAIIDSYGKLLDYATVYPTQSEKMAQKAREEMAKLIFENNVDIIAIGNGTASRESEIFIAGLLADLERKVEFTIVSEAGASVYSASKLATEEYPELDVSIRGAVSIGQRLRDPLAELVKIDPKSIGVGQYQHDVNQKELSRALGGVVEDAVNSVGVDINSSSPSLLGYVAGINKKTAQNIVDYVKENSGFKSRSEIKKVKGISDKTFEQCAGFLRVSGSIEFLDNTGVHPESYEVAKSLLEYAGVGEESLKDGAKAAQSRLAGINKREASERIGVGEYTLADIIAELLKPGRDPRDELGKVSFSSTVLELSDLVVGMVMKGTVRNVTDFGAFVDIGVHEDGLVHISRMSDKFIKDPFTVVQVGDIVNVEILEVDLDRKRISLSMKGNN